MYVENCASLIYLVIHYHNAGIHNSCKWGFLPWYLYFAQNPSSLLIEQHKIRDSIWTEVFLYLRIRYSHLHLENPCSFFPCMIVFFLLLTSIISTFFKQWCPSSDHPSMYNAWGIIFLRGRLGKLPLNSNINMICE